VPIGMVYLGDAKSPAEAGLYSVRSIPCIPGAALHAVALSYPSPVRILRHRERTIALIRRLENGCIPARFVRFGLQPKHLQKTPLSAGLL
jgi:hypothetical protein